ncbi:MAG TPA: hypothetical protein PLP07_13025 [Pyrinomonadaceae bacterium]|nr:hypothetical protein [Acidobacteriota bacterium]HQX56844.1 hypothetical protein [Pyrinomonadaceae bacterium]HQZ94719.1 hypothetical protein [Pyrinomonadaceae bacterium]
MTMISIVEPRKWETFLSDFTKRNKGRRARFEIYGPNGSFKEEQQEGSFESISISANTVTVVRSYDKHGTLASMTDELKNVRGISAQYDSDKSINMLEFADDKGGMTTLHFESKIDGDS